ncbi:MAG: hypothetical protein KGZ48_10845 [Dethiobacter sp.]|nr:hypothetical protein [Dethiobacter sp.]MBS4054922.1 hypothetical protein [Thermaerobacter sp.]
MSRERAILNYQTAVTVFRQWLAQGLISPGELDELEATIALKYGLSSCSIYRENAC